MNGATAGVAASAAHQRPTKGSWFVPDASSSIAFQSRVSSFTSFCGEGWAPGPTGIELFCWVAFDLFPRRALRFVPLSRCLSRGLCHPATMEAGGRYFGMRCIQIRSSSKRPGPLSRRSPSCSWSLYSGPADPRSLKALCDRSSAGATKTRESGSNPPRSLVLCASFKPVECAVCGGLVRR